MFQNKKSQIKKWILVFVLSIGLIIFSSPIINAQSTTPSAENSTTTETTPNCNTPIPLLTKAVTLSGNSNNNLEVRLGDRILVEVSGLQEATDENQINPREILLYLNGRVMNGIYGEPLRNNILEFHLKRTNESQEAWNIILGKPRDNIRTITVGVGLLKEFPFASEPPTLNLTIFDKSSRILYLFGLSAGIFFFWLLAVKTNIIRESLPRKLKDLKQLTRGQQLSFSMGNFQMAFWFFIIIFSFIFIYLITQDYTDIITSQSLVLMGISAATAVGSIIIGNNKYVEVENQLQILETEKEDINFEIEDLKSKIFILETEINNKVENEEIITQNKEKIKDKKTEINLKDAEINRLIKNIDLQVSKGFLRDILSDANGISFHRFQILIWTLVLGGIFIYEVWQNLTMPEFDTTLLTLQGISAGTYLGFKFPEQ